MRVHSNSNDEQVSEAGPSRRGIGRFVCVTAGCTRSFSTASGLGLHRSRDHKEEYNQNIAVPARKLRWNFQDIILLARLEAELICTHGCVPSDINLRLAEKVTDRTFDSIKSQRRNLTYRNLVNTRLRELEAASVGNVPTAEDPLDAPPNNTRTARHGINAFVAELITSIQPSDDESKDLINLAKQFVREESHVEPLNEFLRRHFLKPRSEHSPRTDTGRRTLSKRQKRREEYAKMQDLFRKNRSACARLALDGESSTNISDDDEFTEYWANMMTTPPPVPLQTQWSQTSNPDFQKLVEPVSLAEVAAALKGPAKAIGPDGVGLKRLRHTPLTNLCCMLNLIYASSVPEPLREARVAFIPKTAEASRPEHFRPISVGSYLQRILNKILAKRMQESLNILELQRAFRPFDGTNENLNIVDSIIRDARRNRRELRLTSLDLRKAFDMVSHDAIIKALASRGYPKHFTDYIKNLYAQSTTTVRYGASTKNISPTRGVRQGDPLSPLLFNLVLDDVFRMLDKEGYGYQAGENRILGVAYADDVILTTQSKATMQCLLDIAIPMLAERGLSINADKSFSVSLVAAGKVKKVKVIATPEFKIGETLLPFKGVTTMWKYLGVNLDDSGRLPPDCGELPGLLDRLSTAPLKPAQRLVILKDYLVPRLLHRMICGKTPTAKQLRELDQRIRNVVKRKWLHLESSVPTGFLYAKSAQGGLGLPCLLTLVPRTKLSRMTKLTNSDYPSVKWACSTEGFMADMAKTRALCRSLHETIETPQQELEYWAKRLHSTFDGAHMKVADKVPYVHRWVLGMPYLSGREYINLLKCRINALPSRARLARGRPLYNKRCRHGCDQVETLNHATQTCVVTHRATIKRHDDISKSIARTLTKSGLEVQREKLYREPHRPGLKPDLVIITPTCVHVLDVEICGTSRNLTLARRDKVEKYRVDWLDRLLPHPERRRSYGSITVTSTGIWHPDSATVLLQLGYTKARLVDLTVQAVQGTLRVFRIHQDNKHLATGARTAAMRRS